MKKILGKSDKLGAFFYKNFHFFALAGLILSIIPLLWIGVYSSACVDDWGFSAYSKIVWEETGSLFLTIKQAFLTAIDRYFTWQGTYATIFLMALQPGIWGYHMYMITPLLAILAVTISNGYFLKFFLCGWQEYGRKHYIAVLTLFLLVAFQTMPSPIEGLFWYNGSVAYISSHSFFLVLLTNLLKLLTGKYKHRKSLIGTSVVLAFLVGGGNYVTGLSTAVLLTFFLGWTIWQKKQIGPVFAIWVIFLISFAINVFAPGNAVRQIAFAERPGAVKAIMLSFYYGIKCFTDWMDWLFWLWLLLNAFLLYPIIKEGQKNIHPLAAAVLSVCLLSSMFTPTLYATGNAGAGRIHNIIYFSFLLIVILNVYNFLAWFKNIWRRNKEKSGHFYAAFLLLLCVLLCGGGLFGRIDREKYTSFAAIQSLLCGETQLFAEENREREQLLTSGEKIVVLQPHTVFPRLLYMADITTNPEDWTNQHMCRYYQLEEVYLEEP